MSYRTYFKNFSFSRIRKAVVSEITVSNHSNRVIALSLALGAFLAFSPAWGFQTILALSFAFLFRLNKVLVLITVNISSIPPLIPFIVLAGYQTGALLLKGQFQNTIPDLTNFKTLGENYLQFALGSLLIALIIGLVFFSVSYLLLKRLR